VTDTGSKGELYRDFNNSVQNKEVKVTLRKDSVLVVPEGGEIINDSMLLNYYPNYYPLKLKQHNRQLSIAEVKQASYINHWKGMAPGIASGLFIGAIIGSTGLVYKFKTDGNFPEKNTGANIFMGSLTGMVVGAIVGLIVGWENIYQFNP